MDRTANLIHIAEIAGAAGKQWLYLRKVDPRKFTWFEQRENKEFATEVTADNIEEAMRLANRAWKDASFRTLICGFRFTLPERDEHGLNALFWQMMASYNSPSGIYFDEELGCNCIVQNASMEARNLWKKLKNDEPVQSY